MYMQQNATMKGRLSPMAGATGSATVVVRQRNSGIKLPRGTANSYFREFTATVKRARQTLVHMTKNIREGNEHLNALVMPVAIRELSTLKQKLERSHSLDGLDDFVTGAVEVIDELAAAIQELTAAPPKVSSTGGDLSMGLWYLERSVSPIAKSRDGASPSGKALFASSFDDSSVELPADLSAAPGTPSLGRSSFLGDGSLGSTGSALYFSAINFNEGQSSGIDAATPKTPRSPSRRAVAAIVALTVDTSQ